MEEMEEYNGCNRYRQEAVQKLSKKSLGEQVRVKPQKCKMNKLCLWYC